MIEIKKVPGIDVFSSGSGRVFIELPQCSAGFNENYKEVSIPDDRRGVSNLPKRMYAHRLVAMAWLPNPEDKKEVNHLNNDHADNRVENLEWSTRKENANHHIKGVNANSYSSRVSSRKPVINSNGEVFESVTEAARALGLNGANISVCLTGKAPHTGGLAWKYFIEGCGAPAKPAIIPSGFSEKGFNELKKLSESLQELTSSGLSFKEAYKKLNVLPNRARNALRYFPDPYTKNRDLEHFELGDK